jgi:hypothetical protein
MRQSTGNSMLHKGRQYVNNKITIWCVNIGKHYDGVSKSDLPQITKEKIFPEKKRYAIFKN